MKKKRIAAGTTLVALLALLFNAFLQSAGNSLQTHIETEDEVSTEESAIIKRVVDGDTVVVMIGDQQEKVRFIGIDAPETVDPNQDVGCFGPEASAALKEKLSEGDTVLLIADKTQDNRDKYDRLLRYVEENGQDVGLWLIQKGDAAEYTYDKPFERLDAYTTAEENARAGALGIWSADCAANTSHD